MNDISKIIARIPVTLGVSAFALLAFLLPEGGAWLQLDRGRIAEGELWRLITCHATHWNRDHFQWDFLVFIVLGGYCEWRSPAKMRLTLVASALAVSATVWFFFPSIEQYRGLSGIDTALFTLVSVDLIRGAARSGNRPQTIAACALLFGFMGKTFFEAFTGQTLFVDETAAGFTALVWDHIAGAAVGALVALGPPASKRCWASLCPACAP